jgi:hypothetical protein
MRRQYGKSVSRSDGSSDSAIIGGDLSSPAQTVSPSANQANEPERMEICGLNVRRISDGFASNLHPLGVCVRRP